MPMPFTLRQLEYFVAVAEQGSITAAAAARNVSQASVSVSLADLEAIMGQLLFQRKAGHRLTISAAGRRLLIQARTLLAVASDIAGKNKGWVESRRLSISCFRDIGPMYLPRLLTAFSRREPDVAFALLEADLAEVRAQLLDGRCDLALTYDIDLGSTNIEVDPIDTLAPYLMMPRNHALAASDQVDLESLKAERFIIEDFPVTLEYFTGLLRRHRLTMHNVERVSSFEMQRGLVANGWGLGLSCVRPRTDASYDGKALVCRPLSGKEPPQRVVIAHLGDKTLSAAARSFKALARQALGATAQS